MKNNEYLNPPDGNGADDMTPEELRLYREILDAAYPTPKRDIKSGVMQAVRKEAAGEFSDAAEIIKPNKKKPERWREAFVRWGSLAASIVIVAVAGVHLLPTLLTPETTGDSAHKEAFVYTSGSVGTPSEEAETSAVTAEVGQLYKTAYNGSLLNRIAIAEDEAEAEEDIPELEEIEEIEEKSEAEEIAEVGSTAYDHDIEDYADGAAAMAEEAVTEAAAEAEKTPETMPETEAETMPETMAAAEYLPDRTANFVPQIQCVHTGVFRDSYHEIPELLIAEVGEDEYYAWANEVSREDPCAVNIYGFLQYFGISQTSFAMYLSTSDIAYYCDYPIDVLYESDEAAVEEYYAGGGRFDEMTADYFEYELKLALVSEIGVTKYTEWLRENAYLAVRNWSMAKMVKDNGIDDRRFTEIYNELAQTFAENEDYAGYTIPEYELAKIYVSNAEVLAASAMTGSGYSADKACRKDK